MSDHARPKREGHTDPYSSAADQTKAASQAALAKAMAEMAAMAAMGMIGSKCPVLSPSSLWSLCLWFPLHLATLGLDSWDMLELYGTVHSAGDITLGKCPAMTHLWSRLVASPDFAVLLSASECF